MTELKPERAWGNAWSNGTSGLVSSLFSIVVGFRSLVPLMGLACGVATLQANQSSSLNNQALTSQLHQAIVIAKRGDEERALALTQELLAQHRGFEPALKLQGALLEDLGHGS